MTNAQVGRFILLAVVLTALAFFFFFNWHYVDIHGGIFELRAPLALSLLGFGAIGFALGRLLKRPPRV